MTMLILAYAAQADTGMSRLTVAVKLMRVISSKVIRCSCCIIVCRDPGVNASAMAVYPAASHKAQSPQDLAAGPVLRPATDTLANGCCPLARALGKASPGGCKGTPAQGEACCEGP